MRMAWRAGMGIAGCLTVVAACVGGPGTLPSDGQDLPDIQNASSSGISSGSSSSGTTTPKTTTTTISSTEFDRACTQASDCVAVFTGSVCQTCQCPNQAIAAKDLAQYTSKLTERRQACTSQTGNVQCQPCASTTTVCSANRCSIVTGTVVPGDAG